MSNPQPNFFFSKFDFQKVKTLKIVLMVTSISIQIRMSEDYVNGIWQ